MTFKEWRSLWRFDRTVNIPHLSATLMCPWAFARVLWYHNRREFQAWPSEYETSLALGWRWPFTKTFKEKKWAKIEPMPLALYGAMDEIYTVRAVRELKWDGEDALQSMVRMYDVRYIAPTIRAVLQAEPKCAHNYWIANCPDCARKALSLAVQMTAKHPPKSIPDPHESPIDGFRRREAEAKARLQVSAPQQLPEATE